MKNRNGIQRVAICLLVLILLGGVSGANATNESPSITELISAQERAVAANEVLMQYFFDSGWITEYPGYFGGCYIEENILHVRLVPPTDQAVAALSEVLAGYEDVIVYEVCQSSQAELQEYTDETTSALIELGYRVTHSYIDSTTGSIVIGVVEEDVNAVNLLIEERKTYAFGSHAPNVIIEAGSYSDTTGFAIDGGSYLEAGAGFSAGICGYYDGEKAFVSCGHGKTTGSQVSLDGTVIGTVELVQ